MSLWCDGFYVTPQGYYVIKVITRLLHQGISRLRMRQGCVMSLSGTKIYILLLHVCILLCIVFILSLYDVVN